MSDLSKITIVSVTNNYCDVKIQQYAASKDSALNEALKENESVRNATLYAYLLDLGSYYNTFKGKEILNGSKENAFYDVECANEIIAKTEIIEWNVGLADLTQPETKAIYEERVLRLLEPEEIVLSDLRQMNFVARVYFKNKDWLNGLESGMENSTTLDTWICDWL